MWSDQFHAPATPAAPPPPAAAEAKPIHAQLDNMLKLVDAMIKRVMPDGKTLSEKVPVREGKETVSALTSMFGTIMRHHEELRGHEQGDIFRAAVGNVLKKMEQEHGRQFLAKLEEELELLEGSSKLKHRSQ